MATIISHEAEQLIADKVATGEYASPEAVVDEAMRALAARDARRFEQSAWLDAKLARAEAAADRGDSWIDAETFEARMRARLTTIRAAVA